MDVTDLGSLLDAAATSAALDVARERGELLVAYQPIVRVHDRSIAGFEALMRWQHPERGLIPAAEFIPVAQQSGQIVWLGWHVMESAVRQLAAWNEQLGHDQLSLNVNLCVMQLGAVRFVADVDELLAMNGVTASQLTVEIPATELANPASLRKPISALRDLGVRIAMDDVGIAGAPIRVLDDLEFDTLKLDRTLVSAVAAGDRAARRLLLHLTSMAAERCLVTVAEGIEKPAELALLTELGCELAQGYALGHPLMAPQADALVRKMAHRSIMSLPAR
jgi:EAL domain-containing protein (putative c-di-GMP-specific phosphodiesterase class I)